MATYIVYEDLVDEVTDSIMMRMNQYQSNDVKEALALYHTPGLRYDGILEVDENGVQVEHPISYYEALV